MVASRREALPQVFAIFAGHGAYLFPLLLQVDEYVARRAPIGALHQRLGFFHKFLLFCQVCVQLLLEVLEEGVFLLEEGVATLAEALEDGGVHLLRSEADGLPLCLQLLNLLRDGVPIGERLEPVRREGFELLAEGRLLREVFLLASLDGVEESLMFLVDDCRSLLELCPYVFAYLLGDGSRLLPFLMEGLQLAECLQHIGIVGQRLGLLDETHLGLEVLLEVVVAQLVAELQQIVELLDVELIVLPELRGTLGRHGLYLLPLVLQGLELVEVLVGLLGRGGELLYALQDFELTLQVGLLLLFYRFLDGGATLADCLHRFAEDGFRRVDFRHELALLATCLDVGLEGLLHLGVVELVEELFQQVELRLIASLAALGDFLDASHDLLLRLECLLSHVLLSIGKL